MNYGFLSSSVCDIEEVQKKIAELAPIMVQCVVLDGDEYNRIADWFDDVSEVIQVPAEVVTEDKSENRKEDWGNHAYILKEGAFRDYIEAIAEGFNRIIEDNGKFYIVIDH